MQNFEYCLRKIRKQSNETHLFYIHNTPNIYDNPINRTRTSKRKERHYY